MQVFVENDEKLIFCDNIKRKKQTKLIYFDKNNQNMHLFMKYKSLHAFLYNYTIRL